MDNQQSAAGEIEGRQKARQGRKDNRARNCSRMAGHGGMLVIDVDEVSALPLLARARGQIRLTPSAAAEGAAALTLDASHIWRVFAPSASIKVALTESHRCHGHGYFDPNFDTVVLEADFCRWTWGQCRAERVGLSRRFSARCAGSAAW